MKTYSAKASDVDRKWVLIDVEGAVLGRVASIIAVRLRGKHKAMYTPHVDCGDHVIVINAAKVRLTGAKAGNKTFFWHTGYPGGIKSTTAERILNSAHPERLLQKAVERMVPRTPLGRQQMSKLRVYPGADHPHGAQKPELLDVAALNPKNVRV